VERSGRIPPYSEETLPLWRGEALNACKAGINGIYLINRFNPEDRLIHELGDPELLTQLEHVDQTVYIRPGRMAQPESWLKDGDDYISKELRTY
jgi:hypothetical protein